MRNKIDKSEVYAGTYYSQDSLGVYHLILNEETGEMSKPELCYEAPNAKGAS